MSEGPTLLASAAAAADSQTSTRRASGFLLGLSLRVVRLGPVLVLVLIMITFALITPTFLRPVNLLSVGVQAAPIAVLALGQLLVIVTRGIDLSVGSNLALAMVIGWLAWGNGSNPAWVVILVFLVVGASVGFVNGSVLVWMKIPHPFIVTLGTLSICTGLALVLSDGASKPGMPAEIIWLGSGEIVLGPVSIPVPIVMVVLLTLLTAFFTRNVQWGRWIFAVGGNPEGARRASIPVPWVLVSVYVLCGLFAGIASLLVAGRTASAYPTAGFQSELDAIAAVIIGGASFFGGRGTALGAVVGALIIAVIRNGLNIAQVAPSWQQVAIGVVVILAVGLDVLRTSLEKRARQLQARRQEGFA